MEAMRAIFMSRRRMGGRGYPMPTWWMLACASDPSTDDPTPTDGTEVTVGNDVGLDEFPPVVIASDPPAGALGVEVSLREARVTFSRPMGDGFAWVQTDDAFPPATAAAWEDDTTNVLSGMALTADTAYHVWVNSPFGTYLDFAASDGTPAVPWSLAFSTGTDAAALDAFEPVVVGSEPVAGSDDVDPALTEVVLTFDRPMAAARWALARDKAITDPSYDTPTIDGIEVTVPVTLAPSTTYALWVNPEGVGFESEAGVSAVPWLLTFRTR